MYNPKTDFVCYARDKYGDALCSCYKDDEDYKCNEDREMLGKCKVGHVCKPSDQTIKFKLISRG